MCLVPFFLWFQEGESLDFFFSEIEGKGATAHKTKAVYHPVCFVFVVSF